METIHDLRLKVSKHLAGKVIQPSKPDISLNVYLYEVARERLKMKGDFYIPRGTKSFMKLDEEQAKKVSVQQVSKWLAQGKAVKNSGGDEEDILFALLKWKEK